MSIGIVLPFLDQFIQRQGIWLVRCQDAVSFGW